MAGLKCPLCPVGLETEASDEEAVRAVGQLFTSASRFRPEGYACAERTSRTEGSS